MFGTIDSWLVYNLTGATQGGIHITDVSNASRTLMMNINTLQWDKDLIGLFGASEKSLPEIRSSSEVYGVGAKGSVLEGVSISGKLQVVAVAVAVAVAGEGEGEVLSL